MIRCGARLLPSFPREGPLLKAVIKTHRPLPRTIGLGSCFQPNTRWGVLSSDFLFVMENKVLTSVLEFTEHQAGTCLVPVRQSEGYTSLIGAIACEPRVLAVLAEQVGLSGKRVCLLPRAITVDTQDSSFPWEVSDTPVPGAIGTLYVMRGCGTGGGLNLIGHRAVHQVGVLHGEGSQTDGKLFWLIVPAGGRPVMGVLEDGWVSVLRFDLLRNF